MDKQLTLEHFEFDEAMLKLIIFRVGEVNYNYALLVK